MCLDCEYRSALLWVHLEQEFLHKISFEKILFTSMHVNKTHGMNVRHLWQQVLLAVNSVVLMLE